MSAKYLTCAETAKLIRDALKGAFPGVKFGVRSHVYAGGASINVSWTDGPTTEAVDQAVRRYNGATFDGMQDLKEYLPPTLVSFNKGEPVEVHFGADFIFTRREISEGFRAALVPIAQRILDRNQETQGQTFSPEMWWPGPFALGTEYGTFTGNNGASLIRWLSERVTPEQVAA